MMGGNLGTGASTNLVVCPCQELIRGDVWPINQTTVFPTNDAQIHRVLYTNFNND